MVRNTFNILKKGDEKLLKNEICKKCGLPAELCICETVAKEQQIIMISTEKRKYNKDVTIISGINFKDINIVNLLKTLKKKLACGGNFKNSNIQLQGSHMVRAKEILIKNGFNDDKIKI